MSVERAALGAGLNSERSQSGRGSRIVSLSSRKDRPREAIDGVGVPGRTRTDDLPLRRRPLYPLSYGDVKRLLTLSVKLSD